MRKSFSCVVLSVIVLGGCDQQTANEMILSVGINSLSGSPLAQLQENLPRPQNSSSSSAREATAALLELRSLTTSSTASRRAELVARIETLANQAEVEKGRDSRLTQALREAELAALGVATKLEPTIYRQRRDAFHRELIDRYSAGSGTDRVSVQRVIEVLSRDTVSAQARDLVALHAVTYPACEMNVDLYLTAIRQCSQLQQWDDALALAEEGVDLCAGSPRGESLNRRLEDLQAQVSQGSRDGFPLGRAQ